MVSYNPVNLSPKGLCIISIGVLPAKKADSAWLAIHSTKLLVTGLLTLSTPINTYFELISVT
jgi:hypothetical protein